MSSSNDCGFSGKNSPCSCMNSSNFSSSPLLWRSIISLSAFIISFMRCMSSGDVLFIADETLSKFCCMSCSRSFSMSCSNRCWASEDSKSYDCSSRTLPAKSSGIMSSLKLRSIAALRAFSARRSSPLFSASMTDCSTAWRSSSKMSLSASAIS